MPHCPHLGGHCTQAGQHWHHFAKDHTVTIAPNYQIKVRPEHWDDTEPTIAVFIGDTDVLDLTPRQAAALALRLATTAGPLLHLAARLALARRRARH